MPAGSAVAVVAERTDRAEHRRRAGAGFGPRRLLLPRQHDQSRPRTRTGPPRRCPASSAARRWRTRSARSPRDLSRRVADDHRADRLRQAASRPVLGPSPAPPNPPSTYKFGFSGSTGGSTDVHLLRNVVVGTVFPLGALNLVKQVDRTNPLPAVLGSGRHPVPVRRHQRRYEDADEPRRSTTPSATNIICPAVPIPPAPAADEHRRVHRRTHRDRGGRRRRTGHQLCDRDRERSRQPPGDDRTVVGDRPAHVRRSGSPSRSRRPVRTASGRPCRTRTS